MKEAYEEGRETSVGAEKKRLNAIKDEIAPWLRDVPYTILESAFDNLFRETGDIDLLGEGMAKRMAAGQYA